MSREELLVLVAQLERQVAQLSARLEALQAENAQLQRSTKRQAAPFSKGTRESKPKRPGPKPGAGTFSFRQAPRPEEITESPLNVPVTLDSCPSGGGRLAEERVDLAYRTDLPPMPRPRVTRYWVGVCRCLGWGRRMRGQHADLAPDQ
jgi:transposase